MDTKTFLKQLNNLSENTLMEVLEIEFVDAGEDFLTAKMPVNSKVHQPFGQLHGGASAALAETVASSASMLSIDTEKQFINGIELSINHLKSKREGVVYATARAIHKGRTTHLWEVKIEDEEGKLIALCKMTNIILDKR